MRAIQSISYQKGYLDANQINLTIRYDNLIDTCHFYCQVFTDDVFINNQMLIIKGDDYNNWDGSSDYLYNYTANLLGFTLV